MKTKKNVGISIFFFFDILLNISLLCYKNITIQDF
jgi:hypothetical protein